MKYNINVKYKVATCIKCKKFCGLSTLADNYGLCTSQTKTLEYNMINRRIFFIALVVFFAVTSALPIQPAYSEIRCIMFNIYTNIFIYCELCEHSILMTTVTNSLVSCENCKYSNQILKKRWNEERFSGA